MWLFSGSCIFCLPRKATDLRASCPPTGGSPNPAAAQPPASFRHTNMGEQGGQHCCLWRGLLPLPVEHFRHCSPWLPVQKVGLKIPLFPPSITTALPWHTATLGSSQQQTSTTEPQSSKCFQLILQTFCAIHHSFLHTSFWRIQCWKWSEIRIEMAVVPDYMFLIHISIKNRSYF